MTFVLDLSPAAVAKMTPIDLANVTERPDGPIDGFEFHGCDCGVASFKGQPPWERHTAGDELIHVLAGGTQLTVRGADGDVVRQLRPGDLAIVPSGCWHRNSAPDGVTLLFMTPREGNQNSWDDPDGTHVVLLSP